MITIANNTLRDNKFGLVFRVSTGALLSSIDAATDVYVLNQYYKSPELVNQANALVAMIVTNFLFQMAIVLAQYQKKSWGRKLKEAMICLLFLRPVVDAYRVSTNHEDKRKIVDSVSELTINKGIELGTESVPGCVLQLYVWFSNPEEAGTLALLSIGISALTTGFTSAMIGESKKERARPSPCVRDGHRPSLARPSP